MNKITFTKKALRIPQVSRRNEKAETDSFVIRGVTYES